MAVVKDFTKGSPAKLMFFFALPLMLGNLFQQMYTTVDTIIVSRGVGVEALASVGAAEWGIWLCIGLVVGMTQGFSILYSQLFGAGKLEELRKSLGNSISVSLIALVALITVAQCGVVPLLTVLHTPENIFGGAELYLRILTAGFPITLAYNLLAALLRALGDGKTPLYAMVTASCGNIVLDLLFVLVFHWGIAGAAIATLLAQLISSMICFRTVRGISFIKVKREDLILDAEMVKKLLVLGMPVVFQNTIISVGGMFVQKVINGLGFVFVAGFTATNKLYGLLEVAATSYGFAITTYVGQNYGAKDGKRIWKGVHVGMVMAFLTALLISAAMLIFGENILSLFIASDQVKADEVLAIALHYLNIMSYWLVILYALYVYRSALQGLGDTVNPMISGGVEFAMRVTAALLLPRLLGQEGIFYAEIMAWAGAALYLGLSYYIQVKRKMTI